MAKGFSEGEKVFAKMCGSPPWPARIEGVADSRPGNVKYHVLFFGSMKIAICKSEELFPYIKNKDRLGQISEVKGFQEALNQIAGLAPVPQLVPKIMDLKYRKNVDYCAIRNEIVNNNPTFNFTPKKKVIKRKEIFTKEKDHVGITNSLSNGLDFQNVSLKAPEECRKVNVSVKRKQKRTVGESDSIMYEFRVNETSEGMSQVKATQNQLNNDIGNEEPVSSSSLYSVNVSQNLQNKKKGDCNNVEGDTDMCNQKESEEKECSSVLSPLSPPPSVEENDITGDFILSNAANGVKTSVKAVIKQQKKVMTYKEPVSTSSLFLAKVSQKLQKKRNSSNKAPSEISTSNHTDIDDFSSSYPLSPPPSVEDNDSVIGEFVPSNKASKAKRSVKTIQKPQKKEKTIKDSVLSYDVFSADVSQIIEEQKNISNGTSPGGDRCSEGRHLPSTSSPTSSSPSLNSSVAPSSSGSGQSISRSGRVIKRKIFPDEIQDITPKRKNTVGSPLRQGSLQSITAQRVQHSSGHCLQNGLHINENAPHHSRYVNTNDHRLEMNPHERGHLQARPEKKRTARDWLATENCMTRLDTLVRSQLGMTRANAKKCLHYLEDFSELNLRPLMLKKHPEVVETIKRLRRYVGNAGAWNMSDEQRKEFEEHASQIRLKAEYIFDKFRAMFAVPDISSFLEVFADSVIAFQASTHDWPLAKIYALVSEPKVKVKKPPKSSKKLSQSKLLNSPKQSQTTKLQKSPQTTKSGKVLQTFNLKSPEKRKSPKVTPTANSPKCTQTLKSQKTLQTVKSPKKSHDLNCPRSHQKKIPSPLPKVLLKRKYNPAKKTVKKVGRPRKTRNIEIMDVKKVGRPRKTRNIEIME